MDVAGAVYDCAVRYLLRRSQRHEPTLHDAVAFSLALGDETSVHRLIEDLAHRDGAKRLDYLDEGCVERFDLGPGAPRALYGARQVHRMIEQALC